MCFVADVVGNDMSLDKRRLVFIYSTKSLTNDMCFVHTIVRKRLVVHENYKRRLVILVVTDHS